MIAHKAAIRTGVTIF